MQWRWENLKKERLLLRVVLIYPKNDETSSLSDGVYYDSMRALIVAYFIWPPCICLHHCLCAALAKWRIYNYHICWQWHNKWWMDEWPCACQMIVQTRSTGYCHYHAWSFGQAAVHCTAKLCRTCTNFDESAETDTTCRGLYRHPLPPPMIRLWKRQRLFI